MTHHVRAARRNFLAVAATGLLTGLLFLFPSSTNSTSPRRPGQALATPGIQTPVTPSAAVVINGSSVDTRYGPVQVQLTLRAGRVIRAKAIDFPQSGGRDREINAFAVPVLERETLGAQNARIDSVSGATYTSDGYRLSLQSALDLAHS